MKQAGCQSFAWGRGVAGLLTAFTALSVQAADITFFSYSDIHYGADNGGKSPPKVKSEKMEVINGLPGKPYPATIGGTVAKPRGIIMSGDLINDGAVDEKYPTQWADYVADFGVNGEGRCQFPVFEGLGNHDVNKNMFVFSQIKERNAARKKLGLIDNVSSNGYHYSWDWDGVHFVNANLFGGNEWFGEADAYGPGHHPQVARDFLVQDLKEHVGNSGRPVVYIQHFRPVDENWWTFSAADKLQKVLQDYNVIAILVGHQGGGVNNVWRGINWISSNGDLVVARITPDNRFVALDRMDSEWGPAFEKKVTLSYASSGLPSAVNNGDWASQVTATGATLSGKILFESVSPTQVTVYWGTADGGAKPGGWQYSKELGVKKAGEVFSAPVTGLQPWTNHYYRCRAVNSKGDAWAAASIPFSTAGLLPPGWQTGFIGYEQRPWGGANGDNGTFTVKGSGRDIGEGGQRIDNFQYAYCTLDGDGEIIAHVGDMTVKSREPKAGIMLRESLTDNARHVAVLVGVPGGIRQFSRKTVGGASSRSKTNALKAPYWLKLSR
ncbi:MAG: metallophosphoesterase, partial [bacterium]